MDRNVGAMLRKSMVFVLGAGASEEVNQPAVREFRSTALEMSKSNCEQMVIKILGMTGLAYNARHYDWLPTLASHIASAFITPPVS